MAFLLATEQSPIASSAQLNKHAGLKYPLFLFSLKQLRGFHVSDNIEPLLSWFQKSYYIY